MASLEDQMHDIENYDMKKGGRIARIYTMDRYNRICPHPNTRDEHVYKLIKVLIDMEFEVKYLRNAQEFEIKEDLKKVAMGKQKLACVWIFFITCCDTDGRNLLCYKGVWCLDELWRQFAGNKCSILDGKPKMVFVQAEAEDADKECTSLMNMTTPKKDRSKPPAPGPDVLHAVFRRSEKGENISMCKFLAEELVSRESRSLDDVLTAMRGKGWANASRYSSTFCKRLLLPPERREFDPAPEFSSATPLDKYDLSGKKMAFSFVFETFQRDEKLILPGAAGDKKLIEATVKEKGFTYVDCNKTWNLTASQMRQKLKKIAKNEENAECVLIYISTHCATSDSFMAFEGTIGDSEIQSPFFKDDGYKGKPKIFIIDACRGFRSYRATETDMDDYEPEDETNNSGSTTEASQASKTDAQDEPMDYEEYTSESQDYTKANDEDMLTGLAIIKDHKAFQGTGGSLYTKILCEEFSKRKETNFLDILVSTNARVAKKVVQVEEDSATEGQSVTAGISAPTSTPKPRKKASQLPTFMSTLKKLLMFDKNLEKEPHLSLSTNVQC